MWKSDDLAPTLSCREQVLPLAMGPGRQPSGTICQPEVPAPPILPELRGSACRACSLLFSLAESCWVNWPSQSLSNRNRILAKQMTCEVGMCEPERETCRGRKEVGREENYFSIYRIHWRTENRGQCGSKPRYWILSQNNWLKCLLWNLIDLCLWIY